MSFTSTEEALLRQLLDQQAAILSLAGSESTIISKLGATKVTLADLTAASSAGDSDLMLIRQGSTEKSITPLALIPNATETVPGKVELATAAEAQAFTADKYIDAAKLALALKGGNQSLVANGYQKLPGGIIIQWGTAITNASGIATLTFPVSFPTACLISMTQRVDGIVSGKSCSVGGISQTTAIGVVSTSAGVAVSGDSVRILAIGY